MRNILNFFLLLMLVAAVSAQVLMRRPQYSGGWTPPDQSGLQVWMKGDAGTTGASVDGDAASDWVDQSGNGNSVTQATSSKRPVLKTGSNGINNKSVLQFDGVDDEMARTSWTTSGSSWTLFVVFSVNSDTGYNVIETSNSSTVDSWWRWNGGSGEGYWGVFLSARITAQPPAMPTTGAHYLVARATSGGTYEIYLDGVSKYTTSIFSFVSPSRIGVGSNVDGNSNKNLAGKIAEFGMYNVDSSTLRDNLNTYMATKYGL